MRSPALCLCLCLCLCFCLACVSPTAHAQEELDYGALVNKGMELYYASKYDAALEHFARARALDPSRWEGHTGQALTLVQQALGERRDPVRRVALTREAEAMTVDLVKKVGLLFQHPLRNYILGLCASVRGEARRATEILRRAHAAPASMFTPFESIQLRKNVRRAYGRSLMDLAKRLIIQGKWTKAQPLLDTAQYTLPKEDKGWAELERSMAVLDEAFNRWPSAIKRLYKCAEMAGDNEDLRLEFLGTIARIYFKHEKYEEGLAVLNKIPKDSRHPRILSARCTAHMIPALRARSNDPSVDKCLVFFRASMKGYPEDELYGLVEDYVKVVLHKVGAREAAQERPLLEDTVRRALIELKKRPECPSLYFLVYRLYKLLGDAKKEVEFQELHKKKRAEFKNKAQFDSHGRPRCS